MHLRARSLLAGILAMILAVLPDARAAAQVHYHEHGHPWTQRASGGPDAEVPGWYYNLGITGMRTELVAGEPKSLVIRHVFANSPAAGIVRAGDRVIGAGGQPFKEAHRNGYGEEVFGAAGPIGEFATALEAAQDTRAQSPGTLALTILRDGTELAVTLDVGTKYGSFGKEFKRSASREADRLVYRVTREKPPAGALWRGLRALGFVERAEGSDPNGGQTADSPPRSHGLSERVNGSPRSGGRSKRWPSPFAGSQDRQSRSAARTPHPIGGSGGTRGQARETRADSKRARCAKHGRTISESSPHRSPGASSRRFARHEFAR